MTPTNPPQSDRPSRLGITEIGTYSFQRNMSQNHGNSLETGKMSRGDPCLAHDPLQLTLLVTVCGNLHCVCWGCQNAKRPSTILEMCLSSPALQAAKQIFMSRAILFRRFGFLNLQGLPLSWGCHASKRGLIVGSQSTGTGSVFGAFGGVWVRFTLGCRIKDLGPIWVFVRTPVHFLRKPGEILGKP